MASSQFKVIVVRTIDVLSFSLCVGLTGFMILINCAPHCYPRTLHSPLSKHDAIILVVLFLPVPFYCVCWFIYRFSKLYDRHAQAVYERTGYQLRVVMGYSTIAILVLMRFVLSPFLHWLLDSLCTSGSTDQA